MSSSLGKPEKLPSLVTGLFLNKYFKKKWQLEIKIFEHRNYLQCMFESKIE